MTVIASFPFTRAEKKKIYNIDPGARDEEEEMRAATSTSSFSVSRPMPRVEVLYTRESECM